MYDALDEVCAKCNCRRGRHHNDRCPTRNGKTYTETLFISSKIFRTSKCDGNRNPKQYIPIGFRHLL